MKDKVQNGHKRDLALIYVRESRHRLGDPDESPERQVTRCIRLCQDRGWRYEIFQEPPGHRSGKSEAGRPKWKELKERIKDPRAVAVVVSRLDRASRSLEDFSKFLTYLNLHEVEFVSVKENFDTTSAMGKAFLRVVLILLELESDVTSERSLEMIAHKKEKGLTWGLIPFGYTRQKSVLSLSDEGVKKDGRLLMDREAVTYILEGYARGELSYSGGAKKLNALGYRMKDRYGKRHLFNHKNIRTFVENAMLYAGFIPVKSGWRKGQHTPLISKETAEKIELMRQKRKIGTSGPKPTRPYPLSSLLFCSNCGSKLYGAFPVNNKAVYRHFAEKTGKKVCKKGWAMVEATQVEELVREKIRQLQIPKEAEPIVRNLAKARAKMTQDSEGQKAATNLHQLEAQLARAKKLFVVGDYSEDEYEKEKQAYEKLIAEEKKKIAPPPYDADALIEKVGRAGELIANVQDLALFKRAVGMLFERLEVSREEDGTWTLSKVIPKEEFQEFF